VSERVGACAWDEFSLAVISGMASEGTVAGPLGNGNSEHRVETGLVDETGGVYEMNRRAQHVAGMTLLGDSSMPFCHSSEYQEAIGAFGHSVPLHDTNLLL
jgi:hypothetical protein